MQDSRGKAAKDGAVRAWIPLQRRLENLRQQARSTASFAQRFVILSGILLALVWLVVPVGLLAGSYLLMKYGFGSLDIWMICLMWLLAIGSIYLILRSILILIIVPQLFSYHYRQTWRHLVYSDLGIRIAHDQYFQWVCDELSEHGIYIIPYFVKHPQLEQILETKCWFIRSLIAISKGATKAELMRFGQADVFNYRQSWRFKPGSVKYLGCIGEQLLFGCSPLLLAPATLTTVAGPDFIASRAVLVAFLDFMLEEPPPWVDQLKPPDNIKRPWWWRSVAPLLRD